MAWGDDKYNIAFRRAQSKPGFPDAFSKHNDVANRNFGDYDALKDRMIREGVVSSDQLKDSSEYATNYSEQGVDILPQEKYAELKARLAQDPEYQRAVAAVQAYDKMNAMRMRAPASLDINPIMRAGAVVLDAPQLAGVTSKVPSSQDELDALQKGAAGSIEGYQRLATIGDAFTGRQLTTKTKASSSAKQREENSQGTTVNIIGQAQTPPPPKVGGAKKLTATEIKQQEKIGDVNAKVAEMTNIINDISNISKRYNGKVPGIGAKGFARSATGKIKDFFGGQQTQEEVDATNVRDKLDWISALEIYDRSGKAVTSAEFKRSKDKITSGNFATIAEFQKSFNDFIRDYKTKQIAAYQGFQPENVEAVRNRSNQIPGELPGQMSTGSSSKSDKYKQKAQREKMK